MITFRLLWITPSGYGATRKDLTTIMLLSVINRALRETGRALTGQRPGIVVLATGVVVVLCVGQYFVTTLFLGVPGVV